jgi:flagellar hook-length control protein FliK
VALPGAAPSILQPISPPLAASLLDMGVPQQVGAKGWDNAVADRLLWMVQGDMQFARLKLNPPNLGPLEVRLTISQDQSSVAFLSQHAAVREALEAALPRLREMFDQQSLQLVRADVSDPGAEHGDRAGKGAARAGAHPADGPAADAVEDAGTALPRILIGAADGLIDLFA